MLRTGNIVVTAGHALILALIFLVNVGVAQNGNNIADSVAMLTTTDDGIPEGHMLIEGDIIVPDDFFTSRATFHNNPWPGGIVPYQFDANVSTINQNRTLAAMAEWEARADVFFIPRAGHTNYIHIRSSTGNSSFVGMVGGGQNLNMVSWSWRYIIAHELGHALSFWHEQSRDDRDDFIQINTANIQSGAIGNFNKRPFGGGEVGPYDFDSVLHYGDCSFSTCCPPGTACSCPSNCTVITVLPPNEAWQDLIGQRTHLSEWDGRGMASVYGFTGPDCNTNFIKDSHDISRGTSIDCNINGVPDECETTIICDGAGGSTPLLATGYPNEALKNKYISFTPDPTLAGTPHAYLVTHVDSGAAWFISTPRTTPTSVQGENLTFLVSDAAPPMFDFGALSVVHVGGCLIAPGETYEVRATDGTSFSAPLVVATTSIPNNNRFWADVVGSFSVSGNGTTTPPTPTNSWEPPNGTMNGFDVTAVLRGTDAADMTKPHVTWTDINGGSTSITDRVTNGNDVLRAVNAFAVGTGREFYATDHPDVGLAGCPICDMTTSNLCGSPPLESSMAP